MQKLELNSYLENRGIYVSSGSACALGAKSHVLAAMGYDSARIDSAVRISFGRDTEKEEIDELIEKIRECVKQEVRLLVWVFRIGVG